ncbi:MAG: hypothetical protein ACRD1V_12195 [Vicinamibacterales bacterium]
MKHLWMRWAILAGIAWGLPLSASASDLKLSMHDGLVTILADNVSVAQILDEWARVGRTTILNADKVTGPLITIELINVPEREALDTLLRSASGYIAARRAVPMAGASIYDRVTIMPSSHPPAKSMAPAPPMFQQPTVDEKARALRELNEERIQELREQAIREIQERLHQAQATARQRSVTSPQPGAVLTSPRPGALPTPPTAKGGANPAQPGTARPGGGQYLDDESIRVKPTDSPFGARVLPMSPE